MLSLLVIFALLLTACGNGTRIPSRKMLPKPRNEGETRSSLVINHPLTLTQSSPSPHYLLQYCRVGATGLHLDCAQISQRRFLRSS